VVIGVQFVDMMVESLKENLALGNYEQVRKLVRFLADLVNSKVVASASIMNLFDTFITVTYEPDIPQVDCVHVCEYSVCIHMHVCSYCYSRNIDIGTV